LGTVAEADFSHSRPWRIDSPSSSVAVLLLKKLY